jgi:uncharacterized protein (TIGR03000 family)
MNIRSIVLLLLVGTLATPSVTAAPSPAGGATRAQAITAATARATARLTVVVPKPDSKVVVEGTAVEGEGASRTFETPPLEPDVTYHYTVTAEWRPNTYTRMTRTKRVAVRAGGMVEVDLTESDPGDRVWVVYVPTPADVADEMVRLAAVSRTDVVYEPGCGDARVTIAAVKAGAERGICVDIEPERVDESRARVREAGLEKRIDVRLGDALDVPDLSEATVVFLYMGDHFNLLLQPILWKELAVGSRVVSHRFRMGDWQPDRTIVVNSVEGGDYELHLWTVTPEIKRAFR